MKLKIMNKKPTITDDEIQSLMDFDGLVKQYSQSISNTKGTFKWLFYLGGIIILSGGAYIFWPDKRVGPIHNEPVQHLESSNPQTPITPKKKVDKIGIGQALAEKKTIKVQARSIKTPASKDESLKTSAQAATYIEAEPMTGFPKFYEYLNTEITYPIQMAKDSVQGVESVSFVIDEKGNLGQITILNSLGKLFDAEAIRLLNNTPGWKPASLNGKPIASRISLPLTFTIRNTKKEGQ